MFLERYLRRKHEEGIAEGKAAQDKLWEAWLKRKEEADANKTPFNESSPIGIRR